MYTIDVNPMTKTYRQWAKCLGDGKQAGGPDFYRKLMEKLAERDNAKGVASAGAIARADMTMDEYKQYIYDKISRIPMHPTQAGWQWHIEITDSGFEAMKRDPAYEQRVLSAIRQNFSARDPFGCQNYAVLHFGVSEEESYGRSFGGGSRIFPEEEEGFWERRKRRREKLLEQNEEILDKKAAVQRAQQERIAASGQWSEAAAAYQAGLWMGNVGFLSILELLETGE